VSPARIRSNTCVQRATQSAHFVLAVVKSGPSVSQMASRGLPASFRKCCRRERGIETRQYKPLPFRSRFFAMVPASCCEGCCEELGVNLGPRNALVKVLSDGIGTF